MGVALFFFGAKYVERTHIDKLEAGVSVLFGVPLDAGCLSLYCGEWLRSRADCDGRAARR